MKKLMIYALALELSTSAFAFIPNYEANTLSTESAASSDLTLSSMSVSRLTKSASSLTSSMDEKALNSIQNGRVKVNQTYKGLRVYGAEVIYHIADGKIASKDGRISQVMLDSVLPKISAEEATSAANTELGIEAKFNSELVIYPTNKGSFLVWALSQEDGFAVRWNVFVDAKTGLVIDKFNAIAHGHGIGHDGKEVNLESTFDKTKNTYVLIDSGKYARETYDAKNGGFIFGPIITGLPGDLVTSTTDVYEDPATVDAHYFAGEYLKVLESKFNRNSFDDKGAKIVSTVHFMKQFVNAFWNGKQMVYGDGDNKLASNLAGGFDVIAHEVTHAVTEHTSDLAYRNESGALNEAFSDIMATYAEFVAQPDEADWMIGEDVWTPDVEGDALRYMFDPAKDGSSRDHYETRYQGSQDNGGVHWNSGIANLAFYLLSEGGKHPRHDSQTVEGLGIDTAIYLFYNTFTKRLTSNATFSDTRDAMIKEAQLISESAASSVKAAWSAVGVE